RAAGRPRPAAGRTRGWCRGMGVVSWPAPWWQPWGAKAITSAPRVRAGRIPPGVPWVRSEDVLDTGTDGAGSVVGLARVGIVHVDEGLQLRALGQLVHVAQLRLAAFALRVGQHLAA